MEFSEAVVSNAGRIFWSLFFFGAGMYLIARITRGRQAVNKDFHSLQEDKSQWL